MLVRCGDRGHVALLIRPPMDRSVALGLLGVDEESVPRTSSAGVEVWEVSVDGPDTSEILERAHKAGIPSAMVKGPVQLVEDEQLLSRGFLVHQAHPEAWERRSSSACHAKVAGAKRGSGYSRPPLLGEDDYWMETELAKSVATRSAKEEEA